MMTAMEIRASLSFPADPETVYALLTDPGFLGEVATEAGTRDVRVAVAGSSTTSRRTLDTPGQAEKIIGPDITIVEERHWGSARADGGRTAVLALTCPGQPVTMTGTVDLRPSRAGTEVTVHGDLVIKIPLVGKKLEKLAAPAIHEGIRAEEQVGLRRLTRT